MSLLSACSLFEEPPPPPTSAPPPPPPAPILSPRAVSTRAAFDLVAGASGTFFAWGVPQRDGGGVRVQELGPGGAARGAEAEVARQSAAAPGAAEDAPVQVLELSMAMGGGHLGVAWTTVSGGAILTEAVFAASPGAFGRPTQLGESETGVAGRGNILVSAMSDGSLYVAHRLTRGACRASTGDCTRFARTRLPEGGTARGDDPSEVASPCLPLLPGAVAAESGDGETWFYGICHLGPATPTPGAAPESTPATTVYAIDPASSYAAAAEALVGCVPVAMARSETGAVLRGRCGDDEAIANVDAQGRVTHEIRHAVVGARCEGGRPVIEVRDGDAGAPALLTHRLTGSESRLEAWLPANIAPDGSRAVWTGEALLVAAPIGAEDSRDVAIRRFECEASMPSGGLVRSDAP